MPTQLFDAVLFDLDGTVWHSEPGIVDALAHTLATLGLYVPPSDELASNLGPPLQAMLALMGVPDDRIDEARDVYRARYRTHGEYDYTLYPGVVGLLDALRGAGIRVATATSKGVDATRRMLAHAGLMERFDVVAAASMDASAHLKTDVIAVALHDLGRPDPTRTAIVGDRHYDVEGGRSFGLTTIAVTWGYAAHRELEGLAPDHLVSDIAALREVLLGPG